MTEEQTRTEPAVPAPELVDALVQASFSVMASLTRIGAEHDLSLTQLRVLAILRDRRTQMSTLAGYLGLERSTVSGLVDRAERRGLLRRTSHPDDGRAVEVTLSAAGTELAAALYAEMSATLAPVLDRLGPTDQHSLQELLRATLAPRITP